MEQGDRRLRLGFVIWGLGMYLWSAVLYLLQVRLVVRTLPRVGTGRVGSADAATLTARSGLRPRAGLPGPGPPAGPADPGAVPAALAAVRSPRPRLCRRGRTPPLRGPPPRRRRPGWQAVAALLVATVFTAAVAQARSTAPGVSAAQQVLAASVRSAERTTDELTVRRDTLAAQADEVQRRELRDDRTGQQLLTRLDELSLSAATTAVIGPGVSVVITDPARTATCPTCPNSACRAPARSSSTATCNWWSTRCGPAAPRRSRWAACGWART